eukprot:76146-Chlamydomonas_euryale.AAC.2
MCDVEVKPHAHCVDLQTRGAENAGVDGEDISVVVGIGACRRACQEASKRRRLLPSLAMGTVFCPACSQRAVGQAVHKHPPCLLWYVCWELLFYAVDTIFHSCAMHQALTGVVQH